MKAISRPVMRNIETFLQDTNTLSTEDCYTKPYHFRLTESESENDLMNTSFGQYGEMNNAWTSDDAKGFIKILGNAKHIFIGK
jgi:argininosuccinate synthase